jgi:hypothetical protein
LLESQGRIGIFPVFVVALKWKLEVITRNGIRSADCPTGLTGTKKEAMDIHLLFFRDRQRTTKVRSRPDIEHEQCPVTSKFKTKQAASATIVRTKMLASRVHPRPLGEYGAVVGSGLQDPGLVADRRPPLSRTREAVACRGHILRRAVASVCQNGPCKLWKWWIILTTATWRSYSSGQDKMPLANGSTWLNHFQPAECRWPPSRRVRGSSEYLDAVAQTSNTSAPNLSS